MSAVYVEKGITLKQNQFEELKRRGNDVSELVERTDARGDRGNNGDIYFFFFFSALSTRALSGF